jgi:hypothetical protein
MFRLVLLFCIVISLSGCTTIEYFEPQIENVSTSVCGGSGPKDQIVYQFNGVKVSIGVSRFSANKTSRSFIFTVEIPQGKIVAFENKILRVNNLPLEISEPKTYDLKTHKIVQVTEPLLGNNTELSQYNYFVNLPENIDKYTIEFPAVKINQAIYQIPKIDFVKKQGVFLSPINC